MSLLAAEPGAVSAMHATLQAGRAYDDFHQRRAEHVALLGAVAARQLGITRLDVQPAVFVNDTPYTVIGIIKNVQRLPEVLAAVVIPTSTALDQYGPPADPRAITR